MLFSTRSLSKSYGPVKALNNLNVKVEEGTIGLLGPNGAGKSTLLRILLGLLKPTSGDYKIFDDKRKGRDTRGWIGYMPEHDCLPAKQTAVGFVSYLGQLSGLPLDAAMEQTHQTLDYVGLKEERYRMIQSYSSGMKQRVKLAQALVHNPRVIFLDEPTNGMDPQGREEMLSLLLNIASLGKSIVLSSHLLPDVEFVCEQAVILNNGELVEQGSVEKLLGVKMQRVKIIGDEKAFVKFLEARGFFVSPVRDEFIIEGENLSQVIWKAAQENKVQIRYLRSRSRSLEEMFLDAVEENNGN